MSLDVGTTLNHYSITDKLGEGGMGAVYAADDTQLGRRVAIKVLPENLASDADRLRRFEREARTVASLNHPNVVTLYSVEKSDDTRFLTMELIDGAPLSEVIGEAGVPVSEFFRLALPLVEAIATAHASGITHRDLKPSNIMVDRSGRVKVLDFGLAKLTEGHPLVSVSDSDSELPTNVMTGAGMIVGTVAYMAPEQAEGKSVDARSDVFSLGVLFYEMVAGKLPFEGDSPVSLLSAILRDDPAPVAAASRGIPRQLQRILDCCLAKDPRRRYQTVIDLRNALDALRDELRVDELRSDELHLDAWPINDTLGASGATSARPRRLGNGLRGAALVAVGAMMGAGAVGLRGLNAPAATASDEASASVDRGFLASTVPLVSAQDQMPSGPTFSPDGAWVVYVADEGGQRDLWRIPVEGGAAERLTDTLESESAPAYSPDGRQIAYAVESGDAPGIYLRPSTSEGVGSLVIPNGTRPSWSPSQDRIAYINEGAIHLAEGPGYSVTNRKSNYMSGPLDPAWSPDGKALFMRSEADLDVLRIPLDGTEPELLGLMATGELVGSLEVSGDGTTLIFTKGQYGGRMSVFSVGLDPSTGRPLGEPQQLTGPISDDRDAAVSWDGSTVAFVSRDIDRHLYAVSLDEATGRRTLEPEQKLTRRAPLNYYPTLSRDGNSLAWTAHAQAGFLYLMDLGGLVFGEPFLATEDKVTTMWQRDARETTAEFSADGENLFFSSTEGGAYHLRTSPCAQCSTLQRTDPSGAGVSAADYYPSVSPDGSRIAFTSNREGSEDIWVIEVDGSLRQITDLEGAEQFPAWSPDGASIVFRSLQGNDSDIWAIDVDDPQARPLPLIDLPGEQTWAVFTPNGRLYFGSNQSGAYEIWMRDTDGAYAQVTFLSSARGGLPPVDMFTKFAASNDKLILPVEAIKGGELWVLTRSR